MLGKRLSHHRVFVCSNVHCLSGLHKSWSVHHPGSLHRGRRRVWALSPQQASAQESQRKDISVVLVEPQIPQNAGNVARTCAATNVPLQLVGPTGFQLDSTKCAALFLLSKGKFLLRLKRAGLDYWPFVCVKVHDGWEQFLKAYDSFPQPKRLVAFTKFASKHYAIDGTYQAGDILIFGAETHGLPDKGPDQILERGGLLVKIPMSETHVRSLNLATSVGVGLYEHVVNKLMGDYDSGSKAT